MLITHKKLQPVQCYHIFSNSMVVYLAKNHYGSYSPQMVPTNPPGSWPKIDGVVCPPNISETVAGRLMKLAHRQRIASTTIKLIKKNITVHFINFSKNNSTNRR